MNAPAQPPNPSVSLREAIFVGVLWLAFCGYVVSYAALFAYRKTPSPELILGMPSWALWGVVAPWCLCTLITFWFAQSRMQDEDLGEEEGVPHE